MSGKAEREMRGFLRRLVREGFTGSDAYEKVVCWYCFEPHRGRRTQHAAPRMAGEARVPRQPDPD